MVAPRRCPTSISPLTWRDTSDDLASLELETMVPELIGVRPDHIRAFVTEFGVIPANQMWGPSVRYHQELTGVAS